MFFSFSPSISLLSLTSTYLIFKFGQILIIVLALTCSVTSSTYLNQGVRFNRLTANSLLELAIRERDGLDEFDLLLAAECTVSLKGVVNEFDSSNSTLTHWTS